MATAKQPWHACRTHLCGTSSAGRLKGLMAEGATSMGVGLGGLGGGGGAIRGEGLKENTGGT